MFFVIFPNDALSEREYFVNFLKVFGETFTHPEQAILVEADAVRHLFPVTHWFGEVMLLHVGEYIPIRPFGKRIDKAFVLVEVLLVATKHQPSVHAVAHLHSNENIGKVVLQLRRVYYIAETHEAHARVGWAEHSATKDVC